MKKLPTRSPEQMNFINSVLSMLGGQGNQGMGSVLQYYMNLMQGGPEATAAYEAPMMRQFNEQIVPGIAEKYGGAGALSSSGFSQELGHAGTDLQERLAMMRANQQMQGAQGFGNLFQGLGQMTTGFSPFGYMNEERNPSFLSSLGGLFGSGLGGGASMGLSNLGYGGIRGLAGLFGIG